MRVVGDAVHGIDDKGFEQRCAEIAKLDPFRRVEPLGMADERFADFKGEIQAGKFGITLFEIIDAPQAVEIVIEPAEIEQAGMQRFLARMAERRMADVVGEGDDFRQVFIQSQPAGNRPCHLRDFERMRQSRAVVIVHRGHEHLRLPRHPPKGGRVHDPLAIPLKRRPKRMARFRMPSAATGFIRKCVRSQ